MKYFLSILGIVAAFFMVTKREMVGDMLGEAEWMKKVGGVYNFLVFFAFFLFLWSIATLTGTLDFLFTPIRWLFPGGWGEPPAAELEGI